MGNRWPLSLNPKRRRHALLSPSSRIFVIKHAIFHCLQVPYYTRDSLVRYPAIINYLISIIMWIENMVQLRGNFSTWHLWYCKNPKCILRISLNITTYTCTNTRRQLKKKKKNQKIYFFQKRTRADFQQRAAPVESQLVKFN